MGVINNNTYMETTINNRDVSYHLTDKEKRRGQVLRAYFQNGDMTNREMSIQLNLPINCITGRVRELRGVSLVGVKGKKYDQVTNRTVTVFGVMSGQMKMF